MHICFYSVVIFAEGNQQLIGRHRTLDAAKKSCIEHADKASNQ
jgi:hypothetical protein